MSRDEGLWRFRWHLRPETPAGIRSELIGRLWREFNLETYTNGHTYSIWVSPSQLGKIERLLKDYKDHIVDKGDDPLAAHSV